MTFISEKLPRSTRPCDVVVLVFPGFLLLDATGPVQVFATANEEVKARGGRPPYRLSVVSCQGGPVESSAGVVISTAPLPRWRNAQRTTLLVAGGPGVEAACGDARVLRWLADGATRVQRCCSVCTGAFLLAQAGLLNGRRAVTHWKDVAALQRAFPHVRVQDDAIFVCDGSIYTSAGVTAGIDLCLHLLEQDLGREVSVQVARRLVVYLRRPGGQRQFSSELLAQSAAPGGTAQRLIAWLTPRLRQDLKVQDMADALATSCRTLHRQVLQETQTTPAQLLLQLRLEAACRHLQGPRASVKRAAQRSGFGSEYNLRRAFSRHLGVTPSEYRERF
jgi:transcriptional regulator GlxA family with amidase domain